MIKDHPAIGRKITNYPHKNKIISGTILAVKWSSEILMDINTLESTDDKVVKYKLQPDDGSKSFWTKPIVER